jgi:hypothetical protein
LSGNFSFSVFQPFLLQLFPANPTLLGADDQKIRQRPRPGVELAEAQEGGLGEAGKAAGGGEAEAVKD